MLNWQSTAFVFPGQGSQEIGMAKDFADVFPIAKETFQQADETLGYSLSSICWDGPDDELNLTINTQPALYVSSIAILRVLQDKIPSAQAAWVAGHSLGELTALTAAGAMSFEEGVKLVRERGRLMHEAGEKSPGVMAALLALDTDAVNDLCARVSEETGQIVILANDNCPGQSVVSGHNTAIDRLVELAPSVGAKKAVKLAVSVAAHSPLMASASAEFRQAVEKTRITTPQIPIYGNVNAAPLATVDAIREELSQQLTQSVRWTESMQAVISAGAQTFIEIGSKDVLTSLLKRIDRNTERIALNSVSALDKIVE